jgi:O-antigen/teichoic acid export membrane protein
MTPLRALLRNLSYSALARGVAMAFQLAASIVLSRHLGAHDYGVVGFALIFINFLVQFQDLGLNMAAVQAEALDEDALATAFWLKAALSGVMFAIAMLAAPLAAWFFSEPAVAMVLRVLALNFLIGALAFTPITLMTRALDYRAISMAQILSTIASGIVSIGLALGGAGYWSIVVGNVAATVVLVVSMNIARPHRITLRFVRHHAVSLSQYGLSLFGSGLVVFLLFNADNFLVGTVLGADALGYYTVAFSWGAMIAVAMSLVVNSVLFPTFSRIQFDRAQLRDTYLTALRYIAAVGVLANTVLFFVAPEVLVVLLGRGTDKWLPALDALRALCVYGIARVILEPLGSVIMAVGKPGVMFRTNLTAAALEIALLYPALIYGGLVGAAIVVTLAYTVQYVLYYPFLRDDVAVGWRDVGAAVAPALVAVAAIAPLLFVASQAVAEPSPSALVGKALLCAVAYLLAFGSFTRWKMLEALRRPGS